MFLSPFRLGRCRGISLIALLTVAVFAQAQPQGAPARNERADPLDAQVRVPAVTHSSALSSYRRLGDDKRIDWKEAKAAVHERCGAGRAAEQPWPAGGLAELGITEAEVVQAGRLPNPGFSFGRNDQGRRDRARTRPALQSWPACWQCRWCSASRRAASSSARGGGDERAVAGRRHAQGLGAGRGGRGDRCATCAR
jgi:hypothetical protein